MAAEVKAIGMLQTIFGSSVAAAADFEQAMARVGAVSGGTGEDFEKLSGQARDLGQDTQYSATQAANSQELLARAGFNTNEIISAIMFLLRPHQ
ncbi:MAG: phage tail tape measure protein [Synergistaceae bacterium]|nr:phage tail tape measure protein [Synergistaceae bacterium]